MYQRVVAGLHLVLERHAELMYVAEQVAMVVGNPPRAGIEVEAGIEPALLRGASSSVYLSPPRSVQQRPPGRLLCSSSVTL